MAGLALRTALLTGFGLMVWLLVGAWLWLRVSTSHSETTVYWALAVFCGYGAVFGANSLRLRKLFLSNRFERLTKGRDQTGWAAILLQYGLAFTLACLLPMAGIEAYLWAILLVMTSLHLISLPIAFSGLAIVAVSLAYHLLLDHAANHFVSLYFLFQQVVLLALGWSGLKAAQFNSQLALTNAELTATQSLLAESARQNERLRISRDLHDQLGHYLAALNIRLSICEQLAQGRLLDEVKLAQELGKAMYRDVRQIVGALRDEDRIDFCVALKALLAGVPRLQVTLNAPDHLRLTNYRQAECLLRCVQESLTNCLRHSNATQLQIDIQSGPPLSLRISDNGQQAPARDTGNGLRGMRERVEALQGTFGFGHARGQGFWVEALLPAGELR